MPNYFPDWGIVFAIFSIGNVGRRCGLGCQVIYSYIGIIDTYHHHVGIVPVDVKTEHATVGGADILRV